MKKINKISIIILSIAFVLGIAGPTPALAATDPGLGAAATFSIVAQTQITGTGTISGDVGLNSTGAGITGLTDAMVGGTIYSTDGVAPSTAILDAAVQANLSTANDNMTGQASTASIGPALDGLSVTTGVYDIGAGRLNGGVLTLDGPGIYIFRASSDFISSGSINLINGARACDVYWKVATLATINGSSFVGTIVAGTGVHFGNGVTLNGRALALGGDVTLLNTTISGPTCTVSTTASGSGDSYYTVPPFIAVVKVPNPLALPDGPGSVEYRYTLRNIGVVSVNNITMVDDTCGPVTLISGDTGADGRLDVDEVWTYTCSTTLTETHTNTVVATGWANGISAVDVATATVIVGVPTVPPLINVTKVPNLPVLSAGGGMVTYAIKVTNPGTVALSNVRLTDNKCSSVQYISGDTNGNAQLDTTETWAYTCSANVPQTTVNTVTARGDANGLTAVDLANATVVVNIAVPKLPDTGFPFNKDNAPWNIIVPGGVLAILASLYLIRRKQTA